MDSDTQHLKASTFRSWRWRMVSHNLMRFSLLLSSLVSGLCFLTFLMTEQSISLRNLEPFFMFFYSQSHTHVFWFSARQPSRRTRAEMFQKHPWRFFCLRWLFKLNFIEEISIFYTICLENFQLTFITKPPLSRPYQTVILFSHEKELDTQKVE